MTQRTITNHGPRTIRIHKPDRKIIAVPPGGSVTCEVSHIWHGDGRAEYTVDPVFCDGDELCSDCPPVGYPTDKTRCEPCPRRANGEEGNKTDG